MKLRSGHMYANTDSDQICAAITKLSDLYLLGRNLMESFDNVSRVKTLIDDVNLAYDNLCSLTSDLDNNTTLPGTSLTRLDFEVGYWDFKEKVQKWLTSSELFSMSVATSSLAQERPIDYQVSQPNTLSTLVCEPVCTTTVSWSTTQVGRKESERVTSCLSFVETCGAFPSQTFSQPLISYSHTSIPSSYIQTYTTSLAQSYSPWLVHTNPGLTVWNNQNALQSSEPFFRDNKPCTSGLRKVQTGSRAPSETSELLRRNKRTASSTSSVSLRQQAKIELELARLTKRQNEERIASEKAAKELQQASEKAAEELRQQQVREEDERKLRAAELKARLYAEAYDNDLSSVASSRTSARRNKPKQVDFTSNAAEVAPKQTDRVNSPCVSRPTTKRVEISSMPSAFELGQSRTADQNTLECSDKYLPKPSIKRFEGDPLDYWSFYNRFTCHMVDQLSSKRKLSYLLQHCSERVARYIQHFVDVHDETCCYELAWKELEKRYGQPHIIAQACVERLLAVPKIDRNVAERLNQLSILMKRSCSALPDDSIASNLNSIQFLTQLVQKLPLDMKRKWVEYSLQITINKGRNALFRDLAQFIDHQCDLANSTFGLKIFSEESSKRTKPSTCAVVISSDPQPSKVKPAKCLYCSAMHPIYRCREFKLLSYVEKCKIVDKHHLCRACLNSGHIAKNCSKGLKCQKANCGSALHVTILHPPKNHVQASGSINDTAVSENLLSCNEKTSLTSLTIISHTKRTFLDIVPVRVRKGKEFIDTYALLDSGSDRTFCERSLLEGFSSAFAHFPVKLSVQTLVSDEPEMVESSVISFNISSLDDKHTFKLHKVVVVDEIPAVPSEVPSPQDLCRFSHLRDLEFPVIESGSVTLLIGNDHVAAHRCLDNRFAPDPELSPDATLTPFGWILRGNYLSSNDNSLPTKNFLVRGLVWPSDTQDLEDVLLTDEGESFSLHTSAECSDKEGLLQMLRDHKQMLEFGLKYSLEDPISYDIMSRHVKYINGHFQLPLLWRNDAKKLPDSKLMAESRLVSLRKRLQKDPVLHEKYQTQMAILLQAGFAELVPAEELTTPFKEWFIPHHPVFNPKKPEKVRIVYDCAASAKGKSLNDFLMKGPDLTNSLVGVLLRFRKGGIPIISDIKDMFYQVRLLPRDKDALRFLWWPKGDLTQKPNVYRMTVHPFGAKSSPSCASFCLRETAKVFGKHYHPRVVEAVLNNFYVDDCLVSVDNVNEAVQLVKGLTSLLSKGGFKLTKWLTTSHTVLEEIPEQERSKALQNTLPSTGPRERVLGVIWNTTSDVFTFQISVSNCPVNKRNILSVTNSIYDPLGFVLPVILKARLIFSEVCKDHASWDQPVANSYQKRWRLWTKGLSLLATLEIPRWLNLKVADPGFVQLHFFSDASNLARGTVCYIRLMQSDHSVVCHFVMAKSYVCSPSKKQTIPRLELEAALDSIKLSLLVKRELELQSIPCFFWTDSTIVLQSLGADSKKFSLFPRNRLQRILAHSKVYEWGYVSSKVNPADVLSRGTTAKAFLKDTVWFAGPQFLYLSSDKWPIPPYQNSTSDSLFNSFDITNSTVTTSDYTSCAEENRVSECTNVFKTNSVVCNDADSVGLLIRHFSSYHRLKVATAWLLRYKSHLRNKGKSSCMSKFLDVDELQQAEFSLIHYEQQQNFQREMTLLASKRLLPRDSSLYTLNPFIHEDILRVGGRLGKITSLSFDLRHPIILSNESYLTELIIDHAHSKLAGHSGINATLNILCQRFWIVNAKVLVRQVLSKCVTCKRVNFRPHYQKMADLPMARFQLNKPPFFHVGIDYFGPIMVTVKRSVEKRYGCIFTCLTTRAAHFEVAHDLSTSSFINVLRRFLARRGPVDCIYSDNGSNFLGALNVLSNVKVDWNLPRIHDFLLVQKVKWRFNPPDASHMGGIWERQIRTFRKIFLTILPKRALNDDELNTLFVEIENIMNSSPLTEVTPEVGDLTPLTPNHLLRINPEVASTPCPVDKTDCYSRQRFRLVQYVAEEFWKRWIMEYPRSVIKRQKWHEPRRNFQIGDVVLISDYNMPRGKWPLGKVSKVFPDQAGNVRVVLLKTATGIFKRPISKLCLILPSKEEMQVGINNT